MYSSISSQAPPVVADSAEPSDVEHPARGTRELKKSASRALRELGAQKTLNSTHALVAAYNETNKEEERVTLREWLQRYRACFNQTYAEASEPGALEEMGCLANIKPKCEEDKDLLIRLLRFFYNQVCNENIRIEKVVQPLSSVLHDVDATVFEGNITIPLKIAEVLLSKLDPRSMTFSGGTHSTHSVTLFSLYQTFLLIHNIRPNELEPGHADGVYQVLKSNLDKIADCQKYFPSTFKVKLVQQCLERLASDVVFTSAELSRRMISFLLGSATVYTSIRKAMMAELDLDLLKEGYGKLLAAMTKSIDRRGWYDAFIRLQASATLACKDPDADDEFSECYLQSLGTEENLKRNEDKNLLRFGMIDQLRLVALKATSLGLQGFAANQLATIASDYIVENGWDNEPAIIDTTLDALKDIYMRTAFKDTVAATIEVMQVSKRSAFQVLPTLSFLVKNAWHRMR